MTDRHAERLDSDTRHELPRFAAVGAAGTLVNMLVLWFMHSVLGLHYLVAAIIATECAIVHNFVANDRLTFAHRRAARPVAARFVRFQLVSATTALGAIGLLWLCTRLGGVRLLLLWNALAIVVMFGVNFALNRRATWTRATAA